MAEGDDVRRTAEEAREASLYGVGAYDAIARLLGLMARQQASITNEEISEVLGMVDIYSSEREASRREGYENVIIAFRAEYLKFIPSDR